MDLTVAKKDLARLLARAAAVADKKNTMPVLANALLTADSEGLTVKATDLYLSVRGTVAAEVRRQGSVAVHAGDLLARIKAMPDGPVLVSADESKVTLKAAGSARKYTLAFIAASEFPALPDPPEEAQRLDLSAERLSRLIGAVKYAVSPDDTRANLNGVLLVWTTETITTVATDGHRLSLEEMPHACETEARLLLPLKAVVEIARLCDEARSSESQVVGLVAGEREVFVTAAGATLSAKLVDAVFPSYSKVIPTPSKHARVPRAALLDAIKAVELSANDRTGGIRLTFAPGVLHVTSESPEAGDGQDEVASDYDGAEVTVGINARYGVDVLSSLSCDDVSVGFGTELDALLIEPVGVEGERFAGVVMPMRI